ncbi:hypothetical protein EMIHUDRAFT_458124 [Emiliania huxleyi CCMP1516]|uniref:Uncharacterized protein n=2 Tax=Emiliania huxleyi TaxID=2903 RepID=A0A0D3JGC9_EMIH1|nr:hypothetical protein EMIHUDRAFT_458124 [Emiliania huxleyi CCMP1516]EOD22564.1 hypothetical protein EMIHUDRAFT_458124 [Emiliania huxleyi CCMP1516]|eukprot:XP_005774993.1 hypothetical protein EMIHUDRAFT_458124 [Emiliania huxleyi CCMP1516]
MANFLNPSAGGQGRSGQARDMLRGMANPSSVGGGEPSGKSDMDRLNDAAMKITQNAAERNLRADMEAEAAEAAAAEEARRIASHREIEVEEEVAEGDDDEWDDDDEMQSLQEKRLAALKARFNAEKQHAAQGHGEYREIGEEDFLGALLCAQTRPHRPARRPGLQGRRQGRAAVWLRGPRRKGRLSHGGARALAGHGGRNQDEGQAGRALPPAVRRRRPRDAAL